MIIFLLLINIRKILINITTLKFKIIIFMRGEPKDNANNYKIDKKLGNDEKVFIIIKGKNGDNKQKMETTNDKFTILNGYMNMLTPDSQSLIKLLI
jgi:hypothetical protein